MKRVNVYLEGGLGNQLFQFAYAYALSKKLNAELRFDKLTGFKMDKVYNRKYELYKVGVNVRSVTLIDQIKFISYKVLIKKFEPRRIERFLRLTIIDQVDRTKYYDHQIDSNHGCKWILGSWQSPLWFADQIDNLKREILLPVPELKQFLHVYREIDVTTSVALCLRFYEESPEPTAHSSNNTILSFTSVMEQAKQMKVKYGIKTFYVFTSNDDFIERNESCFKELGDVKFITVKNGFKDPESTLWLMSKFRYYIITNSSFYWWAAFLSNEDKKVVHVSKNFLNQDIFMQDWVLF